MLNITRLFLPLVLCLMVGIASAQETESKGTMTNAEIAKQEQIKKLNKAKEQVRKEEKEFLKLEIENINLRLDKGDITAEEADKLKNEAATKRAQNIENRIAIIDNKISLIERNEDNYTKVSDNEDFKISIGVDEDSESSWISINGSGINKPRKYDRRTTSDIVFAIGFNNALIDGESLADSPYKLGGSGFVELGYAWKTRLFNNSNAVRIKYGFSFQWNKLNIKDNQYFVNDNGDISLQEFPLNLDKAKYRMTNLVFPVHFEFGPSRKIDRGSYVRYSTRRQFKIGVGGYGGFNIQTMQKLKYNNESGNKTKDKIKGAYNPSDLIYGLSGYIALGPVAVYCKYDLNPIFKNQEVEQHNISLGLRFDMD